MLQVDYYCQSCGKKSPESYQKMVCQCGGSLRPESMPGITGTRDNFGIKKEFKDETTGKTIDNWKSWERAGFRNPLEVVGDGQVKEGIKRKINKIKNQ